MENTRHKIVLVDDNVATLNQGKSLLQTFYRVYTLQSAALLFEYLEHDKPDLILLDVEMPDMDGFETIKMLKANSQYRDIPVIFLTSKSDEESERQGFFLGAVDYIAKPFSGPLLQKRISNQILYMRVQNAIEDYSDDLETMANEIAKANERARILLENMPLSCRLINRNLEMVDCNEAALKLFGFQDKEECKQRFRELHPEFQPNGRRSEEMLAELNNTAFEKGFAVFDWTYQMLDGTLMPAEVTLVRLEDEGEQALAVYTRDLREHEAAINEMRRAEVAEMANLTKTQFLAMMSHELRTPMNSITGFAELALDMQEDMLPPKVRDYLLKIRDSSQWLLRIINDILDISKIESGKMELEQRMFDLHDVFSRCLSVIMPGAVEKGLDYRVYLEPAVGVSLVGDPLRLYQVLSNLLSNAVKFTDAGTIKLSALAKKKDNNKVSVYFEIQDTGIGIDTDQIDRLLEPFTQADSSTTRTYGGTGLGLSIAKNIIEQMGGNLAVHSTPGGGTTFSFEIEFEMIAVSSDKSDCPKAKPIEKPTFEGLILVCDDNPLNREVICEYLARVGIDTIVAENGSEGVEIVRERMEKGEKPFDLIFMDIFMPVMDGMEAATNIIALGTKTPIVAVTANVMTGEIQKYKAHGMFDCLSKPFSPRELWNLLLKYLVPVKTIAMGGHDGEETMQQRLRVSFVANNQNVYADLTGALHSGDIRLAHRLAHTLKGNAGQIGKTGLQQAAEAAENLLDSGAVPDESVMERLRNELTLVLDELKPLLDEPKTALPPPNTERVRELFEKLAPLLRQKNTECEDLLDDIRAVPGAEELALLIEGYDFNLAERMLEKLKKKWGKIDE